ncbi:MAG: ABC transporter ATP-binding protein [Lachnospiraceae bacterium]|nr:ABC transporter ATP-binding protein [Lachnospiraceae bacterium]
MKDKNALEIHDLEISFETSRGTAQIIRRVSLEAERGKTLAIVGESGSGKSVTVKSIMALLPDQARIEGGEIWLQGRPGEEEPINLTSLSKEQVMKTVNGRRISMVFQDPLSVLNPTMKVGKQIMEGMLLHGDLNRKEAKERAIHLLDDVGIRDSRLCMDQYPHQLSGGMRQRAAIAIALSGGADILILDEPTTALDVTVQKKILDLLQRLQKEHSLTAILITHDLGVVAKMADTVSVMYAGQIVESGTSRDIFFHPAHPYTWGLLSSIPDSGTKHLLSIPGNPPDLSRPIKGDAFAPRNAYALKEDFASEPPLIPLSGTHSVKSRLYQDGKRPDLPKELKEKIERIQKEASHGR